jgi:hypothetical protein
VPIHTCVQLHACCMVQQLLQLQQFVCMLGITPPLLQAAAM